MALRADLHIHSKYARGASRDLDVAHIAAWAMRKGIHVVGTGDVTHPAWLDELQRHIEPAPDGAGLFRLKPEITQQVQESVPAAVAAQPVHLLLTVEVSTIFEREDGDKPYKINQLVCLPGWDEARELQRRLEAEGNLQADGRPLLGIDARDLLELVLDISPHNVLIPTHVLEPWQSVLGIRTGFPSVDACYKDLTEHIFALETGMSATPTMLRRIASLDPFAALSHSNAHTPGRIGREALLLDCQTSYEAIFQAIRKGAVTTQTSGTDTGHFLGTIEYYAEESRYFLDGHRSCKVRLTPAETESLNGLCPVCRKPLTLGVLHRIEQLADRSPDEAAALPVPPATTILPLERILAEIFELSTKSQKVQRHADALMSAFGPELDILIHQPIDDLKKMGIPLLSEAIQRMRAGQVELEPGYDGEYGSIRLFHEDESKTASMTLFPSPTPKNKDTQLALFAFPKPKATPRKLPEVPEVTQLQLFSSTEATQKTPISQTSQNPDIAATTTETNTTAQAEETIPNDAVQTGLTRKTKRSRVVMGKRISSRPPPDEIPPPQPTQLPKVRLISPRRQTPSSTTGVLSRQALFMLNTEQRTAVLHQGAPLLLAAGPGTGKSRILAHRIAYIRAQHQIQPSQILALTQSPQTAEQIAKHLAGIAEQTQGLDLDIPIYTFAQFCFFLHEEAASEHILANNDDLLPRILRHEECLAVLQELAEARGLQLSHVELHQLFHQISWSKQQLLLPDDCAQIKLGSHSELHRGYQRPLENAHPAFLALYQDFQNALRREHYMDANDLVVETVLRLQRDPSYRQKLQRRYRSIHVDEWQELNKVQWLLLRHLILEDTDICVTGDPDQAIYCTLGGDPNYFHQFVKDFSTNTRKAVRCGLWRNYRTPERLLDAAYELISTQDDPRRIKLLAMASNVDALPLLHFRDTESEAQYIAEEIAGRLQTRPTSALLFHAPHDQHNEVIAPDDIVIFVQNPALTNAYQQALLAAGVPCEVPGLTGELNDGDAPQEESLQNACVAVLPLRAAKGREWKVVYIAACVAIEHQSSWPLEQQDAAAEQLRLFYVGMNRAKQSLILTYADTYQQTPLTPLSFLHTDEMRQHMAYRKLP